MHLKCIIAILLLFLTGVGHKSAAQQKGKATFYAKRLGAILHRNKTLASGDDCCLYYMTKPSSEAEHRWQDEHPDGTFISK